MKPYLVAIPLVLLLGYATQEAKPVTTNETKYVTKSGGPKLTRDEAVISLLERNFSAQVEPPFDSPIRLIDASLPAYPAALREAGIEGSFPSSSRSISMGP